MAKGSAAAAAPKGKNGAGAPPCCGGPRGGCGHMMAATMLLLSWRARPGLSRLCGGAASRARGLRETWCAERHACTCTHSDESFTARRSFDKSARSNGLREPLLFTASRAGLARAAGVAQGCKRVACNKTQLLFRCNGATAQKLSCPGIAGDCLHLEAPHTPETMALRALPAAGRQQPDRSLRVSRSCALKSAPSRLAARSKRLIAR